MSDKQENKTHRCSWCAQEIEHFQDDMCTSCGRCDTHCNCKD